MGFDGAAFGNAFIQSFLGLQQRQEENVRAQQYLELQQEQGRMAMESRKMELDHQAKMFPLELEQQRQQLELLKTTAPLKAEEAKLGLEEEKTKVQESDLSKRLAASQASMQLKMKLGLAKQSGDPNLQATIPDLEEQLGLIEQERQRLGPGQMAPVGGTPGADIGQRPPPTQAIPGAPAAAAGTPAMTGEPAEGSAEWYRKAAQTEPGKIFQSAGGQQLKVFTTEKEALAENERIKKLREAGFEDYAPPYTVTSREELEKRAGAIETERQQQTIKKAQLEQEADLAKSIQFKPAIDAAFNAAGSPTRMAVDPQTGQIQMSVDLRTIGKDRSALEQLARQGKLSQGALTAYSQGMYNALVDGAKKDPALNKSLKETTPGQFRLNRMQLNPSSEMLLQNYRGANDFVRAQGGVPSPEIREPTPDEVMQDYQQMLPTDIKQRQLGVGPGAMMGVGTQRGQRAGLTSTLSMGMLGGVNTEDIQRLEGKLAAQLSRSILQNRDNPKLGQSLDAAKNQLNSIRGEYAIGKSPEIDAILKAGEKQATRYAPAGKTTAPTSAGVTPGFPGSTAINMMIPAAAIGAQANVDATRKAWGTVTKKDISKASAAVSTVKDEYAQMTGDEQTNAQAAWQAKRGVWKGWGVKDSVLKDMNEAVKLDRNDGF